LSTRREFVEDAARLLAGGALGGSALDCAREHRPPPLFETTVDVASLATDGASLVTAAHGLDGAPILVIRDAPGKFHALSMQCTHEGCPVRAPARGVITCPCHGSQYDLEGNVLQGPAQFPLARYDTEYNRRAKTLTLRVDS
jgi:Rieske Fe-S protein